MQPKSTPYQDLKRLTFEDVSSDRQTMFMFLAGNNDIFQLMTPEDSENVKKNRIDYIERAFNWWFGGIVSVFFFDKVFLKYKYPDFRINRLRPLVFLSKWLLIPYVFFRIGSTFFIDDLNKKQLELMDRCNFGPEHFGRAMRIWDRAERVGLLAELLEKRQNFDWSTVPELPEVQTKVWDA